MRGDPSGHDQGGRTGWPNHGRRRLVRFDPAFGEADPPEPGQPPRQAGLLPRLRDALRPPVEDRRRMVRHPVVEPEIWLGWWVGDDFGAVPGRLVNLSRSGAMVLLSERPPRTQPVWFHRKVDGAILHARAQLVGMTPAPGGAFRARFRFAAYCPTELCLAALCGPREGRMTSPEPGSRSPA